jgi:hypothetical protein
MEPFPHRLLRNTALVSLLPVLVATAGCDQKQSGPASRPELSVAVVEQRPGPGDTTQIVFALSNERGKEQRLAGLATAVVAWDRSGTRHELHAISLGVAKPIVVPPGQTVTVPLLFEGKFDVADKIRFQDLEINLPAKP